MAGASGILRRDVDGADGARYLAPFDLRFDVEEFDCHDVVGGAGIEPAAFSV